MLAVQHKPVLLGPLTEIGCGRSGQYTDKVSRVENVTSTEHDREVAIQTHLHGSGSREGPKFPWVRKLGQKGLGVNLHSKTNRGESAMLSHRKLAGGNLVAYLQLLLHATWGQVEVQAAFKALPQEAIISGAQSASWGISVE